MYLFISLLSVLASFTRYASPSPSPSPSLRTRHHPASQSLPRRPGGDVARLTPYPSTWRPTKPPHPTR
ncbi:hypothetical protein AMTR_s00009p00259340 [Amborella trichopoda]|uniref:Secreted protein n=1 Tax=Amborella trichopoda TaxID=13333 RepID=W1NI15_AMBTC|nr:hypothetical protein AMTR_s00009p00259340 [Amborella trichopoda]